MKQKTTILLVFLSLLGTIAPTYNALAAPITTTTTSLPKASTFSLLDISIQKPVTETIHPELAKQLKTKKVGSVKFWEAVSWCETNHHWNDGGYFAGGLGMAKSVWRGYGGWEFARSPKDATKEEQIIVGNRVVFLGYQTKNTYATLDDKLNNKPFFRPAMGWRNMKNWGKDCVNWRTRKPRNVRFTEAGMAEWKKSRPKPTPVKEAGLSGSVSAQSLSMEVKRCPEWESRLKKYGLVPVSKFSYIMWRESRCQEKVISKLNSNGTRDYGLLQINSSWRTVTRRICGSPDIKALLNYDCNFRVAKYLLGNGWFAHWSATSGNG